MTSQVRIFDRTSTFHQFVFLYEPTTDLCSLQNEQAVEDDSAVAYGARC